MGLCPLGHHDGLRVMVNHPLHEVHVGGVKGMRPLSARACSAGVMARCAGAPDCTLV
jgi:hypothetical protein